MCAMSSFQWENPALQKSLGREDVMRYWVGFTLLLNSRWKICAGITYSSPRNKMPDRCVVYGCKNENNKSYKIYTEELL